ncbi:MAG: hypothetical protein COV29_04110 [Candidatus Yanofskybacteria bacterium CG10_big_fil_rev_8_21_14_0_10_36_16]|uniref:Bifunctional protein FolD n=1 Tax=Candidatus Yanofskybacteria bacterium CG10_big_fil_rev_8_21_14_0_10_36_16 TaxID=1975096 RepID=A0A2J0Q9I5_9BACT|nr:MAG: hypothetical protein COV29_04110 [Candidatus Yanofskybacteria bacterium CG10_big_fil_rev_8_21_14_0_10_36_16]
MILVDGKKIANNILDNLKSKTNQKLKLAAILVGDISNAKKFLEVKQKAAERAGIGFEIYEFSENIEQNKLEEEIKKIVDDNNNSGIIIELPIPSHLETQKILNLIPKEKDPDVLSNDAQNEFLKGNYIVLPPAVETIKQIFENYKISLKNKKVAIFGHGILVGKPTASWLTKSGAQVQTIDEFTPKKEAAEHSLEADIIISGVGKSDLINSEMIKDGAILIDFGFNPSTNSSGQAKIVGDVSPRALEKAYLATPVPGGVGPIVVATVFKNLITLNTRR